MVKTKDNIAFELLISEYKQNIHEVKMYLQYERARLLDYNHEFDIMELSKLFHEYDNYNIEYFNQLLDLEKKVELVLSKILTEENAQIVFSNRDENKPLFNTIFGKVKAKDKDASTFLKSKDFNEVIKPFSTDYQILRIIINRSYDDFVTDSTNKIIDPIENIQNFSGKEIRNLIDEIVNIKIQSLIPSSKPETKYLTRTETAEKLDVSLVTLNAWTKKGIIKSHRIGTRVRYKSNEVDRAFKKVESLKFKRK